MQMREMNRMAIWMSRLSPTGLLLGACLFAASLTPSLVPRDFLLQGVLGGFAFCAGILGWQGWANPVVFP